MRHVVLLDLSKAFDCVDREMLLKKTEFYGISGNMFLLLKSYLTERSQFTFPCNLYQIDSFWKFIN